MQEFTTPSNVSIDPRTTTLTSLQRYRAQRPTLPLFKRQDANGQWTTVTAHQFAEEVDTIAKGLIAKGINPGDRVALLSTTRYEWSVIDYAIWRAGATTVAIYDTSAADQVDWILNDSGTTLLIVENNKNFDNLQSVIAGAPALRETLIIDNGALAELTSIGASVPDSALAEREANSSGADAATLIYTSGTTGRPKGVVLTHSNFVAEASAVATSLSSLLVEGSSTLLFLPLAHVFARVVAVTCLEVGVIVGHTSDIPNLVANFGVFKPDYVLSVPRVFEKVYNTAEQKAIDGGKGGIFQKAADTAIAYSKALETGRPGLGLRLKHGVFDKLVYGKLRLALGGQCAGAIAGGAPLGGRLGHFFRGVGVPVYEGYGLTETTAAVTVNTPENQRVGSVGRPVPGVSVAIADDGEVLLRGPVVFTGYWQNEAASADSIRDGWFHSGDIGRLEDGFLFITGRKKELIVTAGGKNVSPAQLEDTIRAHPMVSQCLVVGDQKPFIAALLTIDPEAVPGWLERHNLPADTPIADLVGNADLRAEFDAAVAAANAKVSAAEAIKKYDVLASDFTIETGELTPTMKLKRNVIHDSYAEAIANLYS